jgi:hypothetical protein
MSRCPYGGWLLTGKERRTEMGRIVVSENVALDGVVQDPAGEEPVPRPQSVMLLGLAA